MFKWQAHLSSRWVQDPQERHPTVRQENEWMQTEVQPERRTLQTKPETAGQLQLVDGLLPENGSRPSANQDAKPVYVTKPDWRAIQ